MSKPLQVLMVEDSEDDTALIARELNKGGFDSNITRVQTAEGMKKVLGSKKWDIILSDYRMPGFNGLQALEILKESGADIPFILISGTIGESLAVEAMRAGCCDYVMKDKLDRLDVVIERELREARIRLEKNRAEEALNASEVRYRRLFESSKDGILILDAETGMVVDVNPFLIKMLGYSHEQFTGKTVWELGLFKDIIANKENFLELQQKEYIRYVDLPLETADGRRIDVEFVSNVYVVGRKKVIQCNIRDITEWLSQRKLAEKALRQSEARYRILFEQAADIILQLEITPEGMPVIRDVEQRGLEAPRIRARRADRPAGFFHKCGVRWFPNNQ